MTLEDLLNRQDLPEDLRQTITATIGRRDRALTELRDNQEALKQKNRFLVTILESLSHPFLVVDANDYTVIMANSAAGGAEVAGKIKCHELTHRSAAPCAREGLACPLEAAKETKSSLLVEHTHFDKEGRPRIIEVHCHPVLDDSGEVIQVIEYCLDITERRKAEEELRALEARLHHARKFESLSVLAGGIAHDFNNLLTAVLGNVELALMTASTESPFRPYLREIETAAQRAAELSAQMLAYSGRGRFVSEPLSLSLLVEEAAHLLLPLVPARAQLRFEPAPDLPRLEGDASQIRRILTSLVTNAGEALREGEGVITIRTGFLQADRAYLEQTYLVDEPSEPSRDRLGEGPYTYLEVADTGCGMDAATLEKVFDPFFTTKFPGRGLGLAAVFGIVRGHEGALKVTSAPGEGTTFRVLFPCRPTDEPDSCPFALERPGGGGATVLVVDDEEHLLNLLETTLGLAGFTVLRAQSGPEAIEIFRERAEEIGVVFLDQTMPEMTGDEVYREIHALRPEARVILTSGYTEEEVRERLGGLPLAGFLAKPYRPSELVAMLGEVLG